MAEKTYVQEVDVVERAKDFWSRNSKVISITFVLVVLLVGGYFIYKNYFQGPKEEKAVDALYKAEEYYRMDSLRLALNGDGQFQGFLGVISKYGGTKAGNLARFYAGSIYVKMDDNQNAVTQLKKFSTDSKPTQARAYKLLGDAYADLGNYKEALSYYKKSAKHFEDDETNSAHALFLAAYLADRVLKDQKQAIELYTELKKKFPRTMEGSQADNYLAQLGVYKINK
jgi:hypothetical protein